MPVPFIGRLNPAEYIALVGSFLLVGLEAIIRVLTLALPTSLISLFYRASTRIFNRLTSPAQKRAELRRQSISTSIRDASDFVELCRLFGYEAEDHVLQTKDGFLLGLHRLAYKKGEEDQKVNSGPKSIKKRVVYLHHGLLMNSEVWVCLTDAQRCLPFVLVERGFDVWLGNNRGNKYSKKSIRVSPQSLEFWNFSMDEFAFHDIPDSIAYVLETTGQASLSYIGFSQGTAQAFATLAIHPKLNEQVNVFIALAPAMSPAGLSNGVVDALVKASPQVLFLLFGRRSILSSATMWQSLLYPPLFVKVIDLGLSFLFKWKTKNISTSQKLAAYPHLYSFTSTKSVVHWFQIIRNQSFQMYDDDVHPPLSLSGTSKYTKVAKYPTRNIKTPIVLVYGGSDSLVDIKVMLRELPAQTVATEVPHYEHLDFLWARDVDEQVFQHVFDALESFTDAGHTKEEYARYRLARQESMSGAHRGSLRHHRHESDIAESDTSTAVNGHESKSSSSRTDDTAPPEPSSRTSESPVPQTIQARPRDRGTGIPSPRQPAKNRSQHHRHSSVDEGTPSPQSPSRRVSRKVRTPEVGFREEDAEHQGRESPTPGGGKLKGVGVRRGSGGSTLSLESMREGRGISVGTAKAAGGIVTKSGVEPKTVGSGGEEPAAPSVASSAGRIKKKR